MHKRGIASPIVGRAAFVPPPQDFTETLFNQFVKAETLGGTLSSFFTLCEQTELKQFEDHTTFYNSLKEKVNFWRANSLWSLLNPLTEREEYGNATICSQQKVLIIGAGPCGLRTAIELAFLGAKVVVIEKRENFTRNNVLHLWPFVIQDLRRLGAKVLYPKFCPGTINHISIRKLQLILLKVCLCLGVEVHHKVSFEDLLEPSEDEAEDTGWRAKLDPEAHALSKFEFDVVIGADGRRNTLKGFEKKKAGRALAIAITFNFVNYKTRQEARVEEIGGIAYHFRQDFFKEMKASHGIDLENLVYYKDETHYFVVTAKKASLMQKGVIRENRSNVAELLANSNVDHEKLKTYALEIAQFATDLPKFDFVNNHHDLADVALFDFTSVYQSCHPACVRDKRGHKLLLGLVGDGLYQPFWPQGTGCGRGFISAFNAAWMIRDWALGEKDPLTILAERETLYLTLPMTPGNLSAAHDSYSIDPKSRYKSVHDRVVVKEEEVKHLYNPEEHGKVKRIKREFEDPWESVIANQNLNRRGSHDNNLSDESENSENEGMIPSKKGTLYSSTEYKEVADKYLKDNSERESMKVKKAAMLEGINAKKNVQWPAGKGKEKNSENESVILVKEGPKHCDANTEDKEVDGEGPEVNSENEMMMMAKKVMMMNSNITAEDSEPKFVGEKNSEAELIQLKKSLMIDGKIVKPEDQCFAGGRSSDEELMMLKEAEMGNFNHETTQDQDVFGESSEESSENASNSPVPEEIIHGSAKDERIGGTGPVGSSENRSTVGERATVGDDSVAQTMEWNVAKNETMMRKNAAMMMDGSHGNTEDQQLMVDDLLEENPENELMIPGKVVMMKDHVVKTDDQVAVVEEICGVGMNGGLG